MELCYAVLMELDYLNEFVLCTAYGIVVKYWNYAALKSFTEKESCFISVEPKANRLSKYSEIPERQNQFKDVYE